MRSRMGVDRRYFRFGNSTTTTCDRIYYSYRFSNMMEKRKRQSVRLCVCVKGREREPSERARKKLSENKEKKIQQAKNCLATIAMLGAPLLNSIGLLGCSMAKYTLIWELIGNCRCRRQCGNLQQIANQYDIMYALRTYLLNFNKCNYFFFVLFTVISTK